MSELTKRIGPPETQSIVLRLPWEQWIAIRDSGRAHQRTTSQEIRAAVVHWLAIHELERRITEEKNG